MLGLIRRPWFLGLLAVAAAAVARVLISPLLIDSAVKRAFPGSKDDASAEMRAGVR